MQRYYLLGFVFFMERHKDEFWARSSEHKHNKSRSKELGMLRENSGY